MDGGRWPKKPGPPHSIANLGVKFHYLQINLFEYFLCPPIPDVK